MSNQTSAGRSRLNLARDAQRGQLKARMVITGPSGSGKTLTALTAATILAGDAPILGVDTEVEEMLVYRDSYPFQHLQWLPPFDPVELAATLRDITEHGAVVIDSASHFWSGGGGTLDIADGRFGGWKTARPVQEELIAAVKACRAHVILCVRSKTEYAQEQQGNKQVVRKLGMAPVQDSTLEYEVNLAADLTMNHELTITKSRTVAVPVGRTYPAPRIEQFALDYKAWLDGGEPPLDKAEVLAIRRLAGELTEGQRAWALQQWAERQLPPVDMLRVSQQAAAVAVFTEARGMSEVAARVGAAAEAETVPA